MENRAFKIGGNGNSENKDTCPEFPARSTSDLNFLSITSQEYRSRPAHIHEYMPPQYPEMETESGEAPIATSGCFSLTDEKSKSRFEGTVSEFKSRLSGMVKYMCQVQEDQEDF